MAATTARPSRASATFATHGDDIHGAAGNPAKLRPPRTNVSGDDRFWARTEFCRHRARYPSASSRYHFITSPKPTSSPPKSTVLQKSVDNMVRQQSSLLPAVDLASMLFYYDHPPRQRIPS